MKKFNMEILAFWPQVVMVMFWIYLYLREVYKQYRVQIPKHTLKKTITGTVINLISLFVLFCGGFFDTMGVIQWLILAFDLFIFVALWFIYFNKDIFESKPFISTKSPLKLLVSYIILVLVYYWGGFFDKFITYFF